MMYANVVHGLPVSRHVVVPSLNVLTHDLFLPSYLNSRPLWFNFMWL